MARKKKTEQTGKIEEVRAGVKLPKKGMVVAVVHFNTPELTEALVMSLRKVEGGKIIPVVIFDNSDKRPFKKTMEGVTVVDNTAGQLIDFDKILEEKFPDRQEHVRKSSNYASTKHALSVEKLMELLPGGFILADSDILFKHAVSVLWDENYCAVGGVQHHQPKYQVEHARLMPMLCYLNVPVLKKYGAKYFDEKRTFGLLKDRGDENNWYDTGSVILEDIKRTKPGLVAKIYKNMPAFYAHYRHGSWIGNNVENHKQWLDENKSLWR